MSRRIYTTLLSLATNTNTCFWSLLAPHFVIFVFLPKDYRAFWPREFGPNLWAIKSPAGKMASSIKTWYMTGQCQACSKISATRSAIIVNCRPRIAHVGLVRSFYVHVHAHACAHTHNTRAPLGLHEPHSGSLFQPITELTGLTRVIDTDV